MRFGSVNFKKAVGLLILGLFPLVIGLKLTTYFDEFVFFPTIPNVFDSVGLVLAGLYLVYTSFREVLGETGK